MATSSQQVQTTERPRHRFTVDQYHRMIGAGVFDGHERVELLGGEIIEMSAMGSHHAATLGYLVDELPHKLPREKVALRVQTPIAIPDYDEPEPDVAVVRRRADHYLHSLPGPGDCLVLIEVSDTTYSDDRRRKLPWWMVILYARAGIPETWIVDLAGAGRREVGIERHSDPDPTTGTYRQVLRFGRGEIITSVVLPSLALPVDEVLGRGDEEG